MRRTTILFPLLFLGLYSMANEGSEMKSESDINWITIWLCFFFGLLFTILFRHLNRKSKRIDQRSDAGLPLRGWIVFLGLNLIGRFIIQLYFFWTANYFSESKWANLVQTGGVQYHSLFIFEMFLSMFAVTGTGALIYWFFGRRDIFPVMFLCYVVFYLAAAITLVLIYRNMSFPVEMKSIRRDTSVLMIRIFYAAVWVLYVLKSTRVKKTFVYNI